MRIYFTPAHCSGSHRYVSIAFLTTMIAVLSVPLMAMAEAGRTVNVSHVGGTLLNSDLTRSNFTGGVTINDAGQVLFISRVSGTDSNFDNAYFLGSAEGVKLVVLRNQELPNGGTVESFRRAILNNAGDVAVMMDVDGTDTPGTDRRVYVGSGGALTQYVAVGQSAPGDDGGILGGGPVLGGMQFHDNGQVIFNAGIQGADDGASRGIFSTAGAGLSQLAREYQEVPHADGTLNWNNIQTFTSPGPSFESNNVGQVVFNAQVNEPGVSNYIASFISTNGTLTRWLGPGTVVPGSDGNTIQSGTDRSINDNGEITFRASLRTASGELTGDLGYFHYVDGQLTELVREGDAVPEGDGTFNSLTTGGALKHNNNGHVAFNATVTDGPDGIFRASTDGVTTIARIGDAVAEDATISSLHSSELIAVNDVGTVAYLASVDVDGITANRDGIYLSDGIDTVQAARRGVTAGGMNIFSLYAAHSMHAGLNKHGQVAYRANGTGSSGTQDVNIFTPDLHYRVEADGSFDDGENWTLSLKPGSPHDVFLASDTNVTVTADAGSRSITSLELGGGAGDAMLYLAPTSNIDVAEQVTLRSGGTLGGEGSITGNVVNAGGTVSPGSSPGILNILGDFHQDDTGTLVIEIAGMTAGLDYDVLNITGDASIAGELILKFIDGFAPSQGNVFSFLEILGTDHIAFDKVSIENLVEGFEYDGDSLVDGSLVALNDGQFIPEPGSLALLGMAGAALMFRRRRCVA